MLDSPASRSGKVAAQSHSRRVGVVLLALLSIFICGSTLFFLDPGLMIEETPNVLPPVLSTGVADYQPVRSLTPLQPLSHVIIESILVDSAPPGADISGRLQELRNILLTPIPSATAKYTGTPAQTATTLPTGVSTSSPAAPTLTPGKSPSPTWHIPQVTATGTASVTPRPTATKTKTRTATSTTTPTATSTMTPTATSTMTPTATSTITPTATSTMTPTATSTLTPPPTPTSGEPVVPTDTPTPTPPPTSTPGEPPVPTKTLTGTPASTYAIHVGNMTGSASDAGNFWVASVVVYVHDDAEQPVAGVLVSGAWSETGIGTGTLTQSCTTGAGGYCQVMTNHIPDNRASTTYTVSALQLNGTSYDANANHNPNGCETAGCDSLTVNQSGAFNRLPGHSDRLGWISWFERFVVRAR